MHALPHGGEVRKCKYCGWDNPEDKVAILTTQLQEVEAKLAKARELLKEIRYDPHPIPAIQKEIDNFLTNTEEK
jgi:Zn-finger protein